ncbi:MAG TPA: MFS transporter [Bryobacteraceae bacterium]|nr:MFS transporter [Bryobacteraceae bacterium]
MPSSFALRWFAVSIFILSSTLNYLDRQLLVTLAPLIMLEFHLNQTGFGVLISAFSIAYAASSLGAGWVLDRFGVNRGIFAAVGWWTAAAIGTGMAPGIGGLTLCRTLLGIGESAGVPAVGKLNGYYLKPEERALGAAVNGIGLTVGAAIAPLWLGVAITHGWRLPFIVTGICGFIWIPVWLGVSRAIPARYRETEVSAAQPRALFAILRERNLQLLVAANVLWMGSFSLWSNWITLYLTHVHHLALRDTAKYVWIPPLLSNLGGFFGGWLSLHWMKNAAPVGARRKAVWVSAIGSLATLLVLTAPGPAWATAWISVSFFFSLAGSVNIYALPIDIFGAKRTGVALAALTCSFGILQTVISPIIGYLSDHKLYTEVLCFVALTPTLAALLLNKLRD